jgi:hypothetical protein
VDAYIPWLLSIGSSSGAVSKLSQLPLFRCRDVRCATVVTHHVALAVGALTGCDLDDILEIISFGVILRARGNPYGNEEVGDTTLVLLPAFAILGAASLNVANSTVGNHTGKEDRVKPGERALETSDETPRYGKPQVRGVVDLPGQTIPAIDQNGAVGGDDGLGVLDGLPRDLGEGVAENKLALLLGAEAVLLAVAAIPDPVPEEVGDINQGQDPTVPVVLRGVVVGDEDSAVAVGQRNTGEVPEDEHEAPLLVVHIPGGDDELLALGAGVGV